MLCARARTYLLSPFSVSSSPFKPLLQRFKPYTSPSQPIRMMATTNSQIVEHVVLFKVKPDVDPSKVTAMVDGLNGLVSLDQVLHLTAGPLLRNRSTSLTFTHMLHSRYKSKSDLSDYSVHPNHLSVVKELIRPIIDDIMAVDWVIDGLIGPVAIRPGSTMRVTFLKLKEGLGDKEKEEVLKVIGGIKDKIQSIEQIGCGENFSPDRAKGYSIASIAVFPGVSELDSLDSNAEFVNEQKEKVRDLLESVVVLDYVVPQPQTASL